MIAPSIFTYKVSHRQSMKLGLSFSIISSKAEEIENCIRMYLSKLVTKTLN